MTIGDGMARAFAAARRLRAATRANADAWRGVWDVGAQTMSTGCASRRRRIQRPKRRCKYLCQPFSAEQPANLLVSAAYARSCHELLI